MGKIAVKVEEHESVDRALKRLRKRCERAGILKELRARTIYVKQSVRKRNTYLKAVYRQRMVDADAN